VAGAVHFSFDCSSLSATSASPSKAVRTTTTLKRGADWGVMAKSTANFRMLRWQPRSSTAKQIIRITVLVKVGSSHGVIWITVAIKIYHSRQESSPLGLMQIVHFHQSNARGAVHPAHDGGVVTRWQDPNDRRFPRVPRSPTAIDDVLHLVLSDNPADDRSLPVIIGSNQVSGAIVQFQCGILQWIGNAKLTELRANGAYDHSLCSRALDNETTNHHVVPGLHKSASTDVPENYTGTGGKIVHFHKRDSGRAIYTAHDGSVVTRWQVSNDRRFPRFPRSPTAIHDILHLVLSDNPDDYCSL